LDEILLREPAVVFGEQVGQAGLATGVGVVVQDGGEYRQEVTLAGTEGTVQVGSLGFVVGERGADHFQGLVEGFGQLGGDDVLVQGLGLAGGGALGELDDQVAGVDGGGDVVRLGDSSAVCHAQR